MFSNQNIRREGNITQVRPFLFYAKVSLSNKYDARNYPKNHVATIKSHPFSLQILLALVSLVGIFSDS